jgi:hypothetical protein
MVTENVAKPFCGSDLGVVFPRALNLRRLNRVWRYGKEIPSPDLSRLLHVLT